MRVARKEMHNGSSEQLSYRLCCAGTGPAQEKPFQQCMSHQVAKPDDTYHTKNSDILATVLSLLTT